MAMTIDELKGLLDQMGFHYQQKEPNSVGFFMRMQTFQNPVNHEKSLLLVAQLLEDGRYFNLVAPKAFMVKGEHQDAFLRACLMIQWRTKMIQFEWDESDGETLPCVEFPLQDNKLTREQFERCVNGLCSLLDEFYPVLKRAAEEGVVEFPVEGGTNDVGLLLAAAAQMAGSGSLTDDQKAAMAELLRRIGAAGGTPDADPPKEKAGGLSEL